MKVDSLQPEHYSWVLRSVSTTGVLQGVIVAVIVTDSGQHNAGSMWGLFASRRYITTTSYTMDLNSICDVFLQSQMESLNHMTLAILHTLPAPYRHLGLTAWLKGYPPITLQWLSQGVWSH